ncbi:UDP-glucose 4-epimerase GalE [Halosquirtibacter xylanolyticus]|uniref:UDP-glucose 4-epimerase GalE n=1 Tax=Halosquirtibacter xylanolyticus TaxID=3374599 RepID=UPI00374852D8|nr:UDP-glucose 4-epimerase GalE [Prolixibacteraceae bacterium]
MKKQVLVTGGVGYIGSHTVVELQNEGFEVFIVDDLSNSNIEVLDRIEKITGIRPHFEQFDLCDRAKVQEYFQKHDGLEAIIHFAASKAVGESVEKPLLYYRNNLVSLMNLLEAMDQYNVPSIVFSSSCTVYGQPEVLPVTENAPVQEATSPYGNTKQMCEEILFDSISAFAGGVRGIALRYFNPIGAHASAEIGELPVGVPQNLVPYITQTGAGLREQLSIFGDDYDTADGTAVRDYIHVVDLAKAHVVAIRRLMEHNNKKPLEFFNIGTGNGLTVLQLVKAFEKVTGVKLNYKLVDRRAGDIEKVWADTTFANEELGWKAQSTVEETLASAWAWEKKIRNID